MSSLTPNDTRGLMEAYAAVHDPELRANLEEQREVEELSLQMIENAAYVLFSQGYDVDDVISYFTEATENIIIEDFVNYSEGRVLLESVAVSDEYVAEQFEILNEGILDFAARQGGRLMQAGRNIKRALTPAAKAPVKNYKSPLTTKLSQGSRPANVPTPSAAKPNLLQRAASGARELVKRIPGAKRAADIGRAVGKTPLGKLGSKVLPGAGLALGAMDAANRAKKGDWGGAALSGLGAAASTALPPGLGTAAALGVAGLQAATDAVGLTGDKSKKGPSPKAAPSAPKAGMVDTTKGKRYKSSSDGKHYANYNDALAARNSRRGVKPAPAPKPAPASAPSTPSAKSAPAKPTPTAPKPATGTLGKTSFERRTPTSAEFKGAQEYRQQNPGAKPEDVLKAAQEAGKRQASVDADVKKANTPAELNKPAPAGTALAKEQERRKAQQQQPVNASYEYDAYDIVLNHLLETQQVSTVDEAHYVMLEMDSQMIQAIVKEMI